jgi:hypothetical protein
MKRYFIAVPILLFLAFLACKKAPGPANGKSVHQNNNLDSNVAMSALINGENWHTDSVYGYRVASSGADSSVSLMITATQKNPNGPASTIVFNISHYQGVTTYPINPPNISATYYRGNERHFATSGQIIFTSDTAYALVGIFYFIADSFMVEQGAINVARP